MTTTYSRESFTSTFRALTCAKRRDGVPIRISGVSDKGANEEEIEGEEEETSRARISLEQLDVNPTTLLRVCAESSFVGAMMIARIT